MRLRHLIAVLFAALSNPVCAASAPDVELWRLDCGTVFVPDLDFLSDSFAFSGKSRTVVVSCYLIRHGDQYVLWDTGLPLSRLGEGKVSVGGGKAQLKRSLVDQLAQIGIPPERIGRVVLSHIHSDHSGQAASFPNATLTLAGADMALVRGTSAVFNLDRTEFAPWTAGGGKVDEVLGDRDLFGDGSVQMLATPGHTPGHHSLLVRLASHNILLTGDLWHFREQGAIDGVPKINTSRAETLASMARIKQVARNLKATVIIGHEAADVSKLPLFPLSAR